MGEPRDRGLYLRNMLCLLFQLLLPLSTKLQACASARPANKVQFGSPADDLLLPRMAEALLSSRDERKICSINAQTREEKG